MSTRTEVSIDATTLIQYVVPCEACGNAWVGKMDNTEVCSFCGNVPKTEWRDVHGDVWIRKGHPWPG